MKNFELNTIASREIYKALISGKIINEYEYLNGELSSSAKFNELTNNIDQYRNLYSLLGFEIKSLSGEAFFITRLDRQEEFTEAAANIQTVLLMISRGLTTRGISPQILFDLAGGVRERDVDSIGEDEDIAKILQACGISLPLTKSVNSLLVERGVFYKVGIDRYMLSSSGKVLFNRLFEREDKK